MSTTKPGPRAPTLADLDVLPPGTVGEIINGVLYTLTKPRMRHQRTGTGIGGDLGNRFDLGRGGPGGWWIVNAPGPPVDQLRQASRARRAPPTHATPGVVSCVSWIG